VAGLGTTFGNHTLAGAGQVARPPFAQAPSREAVAVEGLNTRWRKAGEAMLGANKTHKPHRDREARRFADAEIVELFFPEKLRRSWLTCTASSKGKIG